MVPKNVIGAVLCGFAAAAAAEPEVTSASTDAEKAELNAGAMREAVIGQAVDNWHATLLKGAADIAELGAHSAVQPSNRPAPWKAGRPDTRWRTARGVRGASTKTSSGRLATTTLSYCRQCLCDAGLTSHLQCTDEAGDSQSDYVAECLQDMPCCDCQACRQGWSKEEYPQDDQVGMQCSSACARCENNVKYTKEDLSILHPAPSKGDLWEIGLGRNSAVGWAQTKCTKRQAKLAGASLEAHIDEELACVAAALGKSRAAYCACEQGDQAFCQQKKNDLFAKELVSLSSARPANSRAGGSAEDVIAGSPPGWFCADGPEAFGEMGAKLMTPSLDADILGIVPHLVNDWATAWVGMLGRTSTANANAKANRLHSEEVAELAAKVLDISSKDIAKLEEHVMDLEAIEKTHFAHRVASVAGVSESCMEAQALCASDADCKVAAERVSLAVTLPDVITETFARCNKKESLLRLLSVSSACSGKLSAASLQSVREELEVVPQAEFCRRVPLIKQEIARHLLPSAQPSQPRKTGAAVLRCVAAQQLCGAEAKCDGAVEAMGRKQGSNDGMLAELQGACQDKQALMLALNVSAECQGFLPESTTRHAMDMVANEPQEKICEQMEKVTAVSLALSAAPADDEDCKVAREECSSLQRCQTAQVAFVSESASAVMDEALKVCSDKDAFLASLRVAAECRESSLVHDLRSAFAQLEPVEVNFCREARVVAAQLRAETSAAAATAVPAACAQAHRQCGASVRCLSTALAREALVGEAQTLGVEAVGEALALCDDRGAMLAAVGLAAECPAPRTSRRTLRERLGNASDADLCVEALKVAPLLGLTPAEGSANLPAPSALRLATSRGLELELPIFATHIAKELLSTFDVLPTDDKLNAIELSALLQEIQSNGKILGSVDLKGITVAALDVNKDEAIDVQEFSDGLAQHLRPTLQSFSEFV